MTPPRHVLPALLLAALTAGCAPAPAASTPATTPAGAATTQPSAAAQQCTPEFGGAPTPCSPAQHAEAQRRQQRYADAERTYRTYLALDSRELAERVPAPSVDLMALTGEPLRRALTDRRSAALKASRQSGEVRVATMAAVPVPQGGVGDLAMTACLDRSKLVLQQTGGGAPPKPRALATIQFVDGPTGPLVADIKVSQEESC